MELLRRAVPFDSGPLDDVETALAADQLFGGLEAEENAPNRGEVWLFDLGMAEKVRPALVVSVGYGDRDRALITILPHTTSLRRFPIRDYRQCPVLEGGRIPGPKRGDISERQGDSKVGDAQIRSFQFGLRRASSLAR